MPNLLTHNTNLAVALASVINEQHFTFKERLGFMFSPKLALEVGALLGYRYAMKRLFKEFKTTQK